MIYNKSITVDGSVCVEGITTDFEREITVSYKINPGSDVVAPSFGDEIGEAPYPASLGDIIVIKEYIQDPFTGRYEPEDVTDEFIDYVLDNCEDELMEYARTYDP